MKKHDMASATSSSVLGTTKVDVLVAVFKLLSNFWYSVSGSSISSNFWLVVEH